MKSAEETELQYKFGEEIRAFRIAENERSLREF
jgi:hypothetical protein